MLLAFIVAACSAPTASSTVPTTPSTTAPSWDVSTPFVGFSLSPASFDETGFNEFFEVASDAGDLVAWVGAWQEIDTGGTLIYQLAEQHDYVPVVVTGFPTDADGLRVVPDDPEEMIDEITTWLEDHPVPYLGFGVEINAFLHEKAPDDFDWFVEVFPDVVDAIHAVSPSTLVFPGFQLERMRGLKGGLFGGEDTEPVWELIDMFPSADLIAFTTYPGLIFTEPADVPADYYVEIFQHTDKPILFTEVGWQAAGDLGEWAGTDGKQDEFVGTRVDELASISEMVIWSFLWDQEAGPRAFGTMGLIAPDGERRPAFDTWQDLFG